MWNTRFPCILDSTVAHGASLRGRASSPAINRDLCGSLPYILGADLYPMHMWTRSAYNPSDDGTRHRKIRRAKPPSERLRASQTLFEKRQPRVLRCLKKRRDCVRGPLRFWDFFAGVSAPLSAALKRRGWEVISFELLTGGEAHNLLDPKIKRKLCDDLRAGRADGAAFGTPCHSWSSWMYIQPWYSRSQRNPWGNGAHPTEKLGNRQVRATLEYAAAADEGNVPWMLENPWTSLMWWVPALKRRLRKKASYFAMVDWCQYGRTWKKRTRFEGRMPFLPSLTKQCQGGHVHQQLKGTVKCPDGKWRSWTSLAGEYSREFCEAFADAMTAWASARRKQRRG